MADKTWSQIAQGFLDQAPVSVISGGFLWGSGKEKVQARLSGNWVDGEESVL